MSNLNYHTHQHYTRSELTNNLLNIKKTYNCIRSRFKKGQLEIFLKIKPSVVSVEYTIKLTARLNGLGVNVFVVSPQINRTENGKSVPHMFSNGSLCLFYPKYNEFNHTDLWSETIIPWTALWLFYYEIWKETGEWLGGGIHNNVYSPPA